MTPIIVTWGTYHNVAPRGVVADVCPACRGIAPFIVNDHFNQSHVWGIPIGTGWYLGATLDCNSCRASFPFVEQTYLDVMALSSLTAPGAFRRIIEATNPRLEWMLGIGDRLRVLAKNSPYRTAAGESTELLPRALDLIETLLLRGDDLRALFGRLESWEGLTEAERREIVDALSEHMAAGDR